MVRISINGRLYDGADYFERYGDVSVLDDVLEHGPAAESFMHPHSFWWKNLRDSQVMQRLALGQCFECGDPAAWHVRRHNADGTVSLAYLRCDACHGVELAEDSRSDHDLIERIDSPAAPGEKAEQLRREKEAVRRPDGSAGLTCWCCGRVQPATAIRGACCYNCNQTLG
ncbi:MAG TPA: hypothetical protein VEA69_16780 [Tepidisphaeraceae bacterium]|nr:hypothetical protein [Tepidisphaeraceae bacterium]